MKKLFILAVLCTVFLTGCMDIAMQYTPTDELSAKYKDQVKDDYLTIFYSVKDSPNGKMLLMSVKNTGNIFVQNLSFNYDVAADKASTYNYKNLGNLKNRASKDLTLQLPQNGENTFKINYLFTPVIEDAFLNKDSQPGFVQTEPIKGTLVIYIGK